MNDEPYNDGWTPDVCERVFHAALDTGDMKGVEITLRLLAVRDPERAQRLIDSCHIALALTEVPR